MLTCRKHSISGKIVNRYACILYSFDFENEHTDAGSKELKFELTIDPDAFISKFEANIDGELFVGQTKERETASKEYHEAKQQHENAILVSQPHEDIPNVFQIKTNIDCQSKVSLTISIEQYLQKKLSFNQLTVQILKNFQQYNIEPKYESIQFEFDIFDESGIYDVSLPSTVNAEAVEESQREISVEKCMTDETEKTYKVNGQIICNLSSNNELTVHYKIKGEAQESHVLFDAASGTFCHILSDIVSDAVAKQKVHHYPTQKSPKTNSNNENPSNNPPKQQQPSNLQMTIARRVVFVVDKSGSMMGDKWRRTVSATVAAIKLLRASVDKFSIILFDYSYHLFQGDDPMQFATEERIQTAISWMQKYEAAGGTSFAQPLMNAIDLIRADIKRQPKAYFTNQILFITDGEDRNLQQLLLDINKANNLDGIDKYNKKISIFTFGVGRDGNDSGWIGDLNHSFLKSLAVNNDGFYKRIKTSSADTAMTEYFQILSKPVLTDIRVDYHSKNVSDLTDVHFNTLYHGNDLIVCGKIKSDKVENYQLTATITATTAFCNTLIPQKICKLITIPLNSDEQTDNNAERIWAYFRLQQYAQKKLMLNDMIELEGDEKNEEDELPLSLAMKYKFVTPWTSMIVVKREQDGEQKNDESIPVQSQESELSARAPQHSAPMMEASPLTAEMLQDAKPAEWKRLIGERLFPKIQAVEPRLAGKITGMLLEMDNSELLLLLSEERALMNKIDQALDVLKDHQQKQSQTNNEDTEVQANESQLRQSPPATLQGTSPQIQKIRSREYFAVDFELLVSGYIRLNCTTCFMPEEMSFLIASLSKKTAAKSGDKKVSIAMVGHAHSGKSTLAALLSFELGSSISCRLEQLKEERQRGNTITWHARQIKTDSYVYSLIDTPGCKKFTKNMICGTSQADVAVLVVPANTGDFEASIAKGNQKTGEVEGETLQHARICHTLGIVELIVCINKMDHETVKYSRKRYREIKDKVAYILTKTGYKTKKIPFIPMSARSEANIMVPAVREMPWWQGFKVKARCDRIRGRTLYDALENKFLPYYIVGKRRTKKPFRMPISGVHRIKGIGHVVTGRIEQGKIECGAKVKFALSQCSGIARAIEMHHQKMDAAQCGDHVGINIANLVDDNLPGVGDVLYIEDKDMDPSPPRAVSQFTALVYVHDVPGKLGHAKLLKNMKTGAMEYRGGYTPCIHVRTGRAPCQMIEIKWKFGKSTSCVKVENVPYIEAGDQAEVVFMPQAPLIVEPFDDCKPLGRIAVMQSNHLQMVGKVTFVRHVEQ